MANTVTKAIVYQSLLDEVINAGLTSSPLTANSNRIQYNGGNSVKIAKLSVGGYGAYNRDTGYPAGAATLAWEDHTIAMDRGISFNVDVMDADETMQTLSASNIIAEFGRTHAVPELDAYRYSKIFQSIVDDASVRYGYYAPDATTILGTLQGHIGDIQNVIGEQEPLVCFMSGAAFKVLTQSSQLTRQLGVQNITGTNGVTTKVYDVDGVRIIPVPSARMKTEYAFSPTNGFTAKSFAQECNWIIMSTNAAVGFVKHQKMKIVSADENQTADAEKIMAREYHDLWVYENKHNAIYVSLKTATVEAVTTVATTSGKVTVTLGAAYTNRDTGHKFYYLDTNATTVPAVPACYDELDVTGWTEIKEATAVEITVTATHIARVVQLDENDRVVQYKHIAAV